MKILFIVGSLRKQSFNRQLAQEAAKMLEGRADVSFLDYGEIPFFSQDLEDPVLPAVAKARQECKEADGIWIFSPEYNGQIPGVLKNLLDWLSRTMKPGEFFKNTAVYGKPATLSGIGGSNRTKGCRELLDRLLKFMGMNVMIEGQVGLAIKPDEFKTSVLVLDDAQKEELEKQCSDFIAFIEEAEKEAAK